ncbi:hypothetical protein R3P38DRAFT_3614332, partial [Favolaschia claudopus]
MFKLYQAAWDDILKTVFNLSRVTIDENEGLRSRIATLQELSATNVPAPIILCVINGDEKIFSSFAAGHKGGISAADSLTQQICNYLLPEGFQNCREIWFWTTVFFNRRTLLDKLATNNVCSTEQFDNFIAGFSGRSRRFSFIDVGNSNDAEPRMRDYVVTHTQLPQTVRVFLAG